MNRKKGLKRSGFKRKKKSVKRKKLPKPTTLRNKADKIFSQLIRLRDKARFDRCPFCGVNDIECCFHIITRKRYSVRWDPRNAVGACHSCNYAERNNSHPFIQWYINRFGVEQYDSLVTRSKQVANFGRAELESIVRGLEEHGLVQEIDPKLDR